MDSLPYSIPASLIRQHRFCPRIPWYNEVMQINPGDRPWQHQGVDYHKQQEMLNKRRNLSRYGLDQGELLQQVVLRDDKTGIHGICDALIVQADQVFVLEFKMNGKRPVTGQIHQLVAYAIMAEHQFACKCRQGFILYGQRGHTVQIDIEPKLKARVLADIDEIRSNINKPVLPSSSATMMQCGQCEYFNFCADRE